jgi:hypothetical protein
MEVLGNDNLSYLEFIQCCSLVVDVDRSVSILMFGVKPGVFFVVLPREDPG